jgi:hypothetical protein
MAGKKFVSVKLNSPEEFGDPRTSSMIRFRTTLLRPKSPAKAVSWTFLTLPKEASAKLPSRSMTSVEGTFNGLAFQATLEPDGEGGHWLKVDRKMREKAGAQVGEVVTLEIAPVAEEPEPKVPADLRKALAVASPAVRKVWSDITPIARRDWVHWIVSAKHRAHEHQPRKQSHEAPHPPTSLAAERQSSAAGLATA